MINGESKISTANTYTKTAVRQDNVDKFPAADWNDISQAVETAHEKINSILNPGSLSLSGTSVSVLSTDTDANISSNNDLNLSANNEVYISADSVRIDAFDGISFSQDGGDNYYTLELLKDAMLWVESNKIAILAVLTWFASQQNQNES